MLDAATATLDQLLDAAANEATRPHWEGYLKGAARFRGVPMACIRAAVTRTWCDHDLGAATTDDLLALAHRWFAAATTEDKLAAVLQLCRDNLVVDDRFAHTGPGWVLPELPRSDPGAVRDFVASETRLSEEARRMARARLRPGPYRRR